MTGVRTGPRSLTMMLIPRSDQVETRVIKTSYSHAAGTAHVFFDGARVPVENVLGGEGNGLKVILSNFNHERTEFSLPFLFPTLTTRLTLLSASEQAGSFVLVSLDTVDSFSKKRSNGLI